MGAVASSLLGPGGLLPPPTRARHGEPLAAGMDILFEAFGTFAVQSLRGTESYESVPIPPSQSCYMVYGRLQEQESLHPPILLLYPVDVLDARTVKPTTDSVHVFTSRTLRSIVYYRGELALETMPMASGEGPEDTRHRVILRVADEFVSKKFWKEQAKQMTINFRSYWENLDRFKIPRSLPGFSRVASGASSGGHTSGGAGSAGTTASSTPAISSTPRAGKAACADATPSVLSTASALSSGDAHDAAAASASAMREAANAMRLARQLAEAVLGTPAAGDSGGKSPATPPLGTTSDGATAEAGSKPEAGSMCVPVPSSGSLTALATTLLAALAAADSAREGNAGDALGGGAHHAAPSLQIPADAPAVVADPNTQLLVQNKGHAPASASGSSTQSNSSPSGAGGGAFRVAPPAMHYNPDTHSGGLRDARGGMQAAPASYMHHHHAAAAAAAASMHHGARAYPPTYAPGGFPGDVGAPTWPPPAQGAGSGVHRGGGYHAGSGGGSGGTPAAATHRAPAGYAGRLRTGAAAGGIPPPDLPPTYHVGGGSGSNGGGRGAAHNGIPSYPPPPPPSSTAMSAGPGGAGGGGSGGSGNATTTLPGSGRRTPAGGHHAMPVPPSLAPPFSSSGGHAFAHPHALPHSLATMHGGGGSGGSSDAGHRGGSGAHPSMSGFGMHPSAGSAYGGMHATASAYGMGTGGAPSGGSASYGFTAMPFAPATAPMHSMPPLTTSRYVTSTSAGMSMGMGGAGTLSVETGLPSMALPSDCELSPHGSGGSSNTPAFGIYRTEPGAQLSSSAFPFHFQGYDAQLTHTSAYDVYSMSNLATAMSASGSGGGGNSGGSGLIPQRMCASPDSTTRASVHASGSAHAGSGGGAMSTASPSTDSVMGSVVLPSPYNMADAFSGTDLMLPLNMLHLPSAGSSEALLAPWQNFSCMPTGSMVSSEAPTGTARGRATA